MRRGRAAPDYHKRKNGRTKRSARPVVVVKEGGILNVEGRFFGTRRPSVEGVSQFGLHAALFSRPGVGRREGELAARRLNEAYLVVVVVVARYRPEHGFICHVISTQSLDEQSATSSLNLTPFQTKAAPCYRPLPARPLPSPPARLTTIVSLSFPRTSGFCKIICTRTELFALPPSLPLFRILRAYSEFRISALE